MNITIIASGKEFIFRKLTEDEIATIEDKKAIRNAKNDVNLYDDLVEDIKKTLISPSYEEFDKFLEEYPNFTDYLTRKLIMESGYQVLDPAIVPEEIKLQYKFPIVGMKWKIDENTEETILFKKISRQDAMLIKKEIDNNYDTLMTKKMKERAKILCLDKDKANQIAITQPAFFVAAGWFLWLQTIPKIEEFEKK